jgi:hypothetical protein
MPLASELRHIGQDLEQFYFLPLIAITAQLLVGLLLQKRLAR